MRHLFSFFLPSTKTNHCTPPKESCKNEISKTQIEIMFGKKNPNDPNCYFKENEKREVNEDFNSVANGRFQ